MYLQGDLQIMFDALYYMGVIDPVLEMDWTEAVNELPAHMRTFSEVVGVVNDCQHDMNLLMSKLENFDEKTLSFLAMEVAKEFADFHAREELQ